MDSSSIRNSLNILEKRYRELREIGENKFHEREKEKSAAQRSVEQLSQQLSAKAVELETTKQEKADSSERMKALETELARVMGQLDAQANEKAVAQKSVEELKEQLAIKQKALQASNAVCSERFDQLSRIEEEMHTLHLRYLRSRRS